MLYQEVGVEPEVHRLLRQIQRRTVELNLEFEFAHQDIIRALVKHDIFLESEEQLTDVHREWLKRYFHSNIRKFVCPIVISDKVNLGEVIADDATYLVAELRKADHYIYSLIEVPTDHHGRFIELPKITKRKKPLVLLDNAIRVGLPEIFEGYFDFDDVQAWSMKLTRDAEYDLSGEIDDSLMDRLSSGLKQRLTSEPTRLVYDRDMPDRVLAMLKRELGIAEIDAVIPGGRYHNMKDFLSFPSIGRASLRNSELPPIPSKVLDGQRNYFSILKVQDVLLHYPYHDFYHLTEWLRQAATDPAVESVKISLYRVASSSLIIKSLLDAVANGKDVSVVVVELQARFDEEANIQWSKVLTDAGVRVTFGIANLKVHSKLCLVTRREDGQRVRYAHIGTGNFNEKTAQTYTDFSLLTARPEITAEVRQVFSFFNAPYLNFVFRHLWVSPVNQRKKIIQQIDREIGLADSGKSAKITLKVNYLADDDLITKLYEASRAGVVVAACVRGVCSLIPSVPGMSDRIRVISIVDSFLEHPRVMIFHNDGDPDVYISSADWMTRNMDNRVEVTAPIYDDYLKKIIIDLLDLQFKDTVKARLIDEDQSNQYVGRGNRRKVRCQINTYEYIKNFESA